MVQLFMVMVQEGFQTAPLFINVEPPGKEVQLQGYRMAGYYTQTDPAGIQMTEVIIAGTMVSGYLRARLRKYTVGVEGIMHPGNKKSGKKMITEVSMGKNMETMEEVKDITIKKNKIIFLICLNKQTITASYTCSFVRITFKALSLAVMATSMPLFSVKSKTFVIASSCPLLIV